MSTKWTQRELKVLTTLYDPFTFTRELVAERLGRSPRAVKDKLRRDKLQKQKWKRWSEEENKLLLEMGKKRWWPRSAYTSAFPGRSYGSIKRHLWILQNEHKD